MLTGARWAAILGFGLSLAPTWAVAQDGVPSEEQAGEPGAGDIVVTARARELYRVAETTTGKLPQEPLASSLNIQVINDDLIRDQGARDAQDIYRNLAGVTTFSYAGVTARGFRQEEIYFDGLRGDPYAGFSVPVLFNVERVEFLKGPAGMLYGPGAPGGLFNYVTKAPQADFAVRAAAVAGTEARFGGSFEATGRLASGPFAPDGRIGVFYEERNTPRRNADSLSLIADGGLAFDIGAARATVQATRYEQDLGGNRLRGVPTDDSGRFLTDRRWNHNEASDFLSLEANVVQARLDWPVFDSLSLDAGVRYSEGVERQNYHEPNGLFDSDSDGLVDSSRRQFRDQRRAGDYLSFGANAVWSERFGVLDNRVLVGVDLYEDELVFDGRSVSGQNLPVAGRPTPLSLFAPAYGVTDPTSYTLPPFTRSVTEEKRQGAYLLDEATIGRFILTLGVRTDAYEDDSDGTRFEDEATTFRGGLVYRVLDDVSLYAQWADSFEPQSAEDQDVRAGGPFAPTEGEIMEGGIKTSLFDGRFQSTAAIYEIRRTNILQADPSGDVGGDGIDDLVAFGEVVSRGAELDFAADLTDDWVLTAAYAYNDTRITESNGLTAITNSVGDRFANAPRHALGFWTRYQWPRLGLAVALGGDYVDKRLSLSGQKVRPHAVFDASIIYEVGPWAALLRIDNLTDETYAVSGFISRTGHFPGEPRSLFLELSRLW